MKNEWIILFLLFSFLFLLRLNHLYADPPISPHFIHFEVDEGWKVLIARNKVVFGGWGSNIWQLLNHPLFILIELIVFNIFGVGTIQARTVPIVCAFFTFLLLYKIAKKDLGSKWGLILLLLLGSDFIFLIYNRTAVHETISVFFMVMTLYFEHTGGTSKGRKKFIYYFLAGFAVILSCAVKMYCIFMLPVCIVSFMWNEKRINWTHIFISFITGVLLGVFSFFLLYWGLLYNFHFMDIQIVFNTIFPKKNFTINRRIGEHIVNTRNNFILLVFLIKKLKGFVLFDLGQLVEEHFVSVFLLCTYFTGLALHKNKSKEETETSLAQSERFFIVWLLLGIFFFFSTSLTTRFRHWYLTILLPAVYFLATVSLKKISDKKEKIWNINHKGKTGVVCSAFLHQIVFFVLIVWVFKNSFFMDFISSYKYNQGEIKWIICQLSWLISFVMALLTTLLKGKFSKRRLSEKNISIRRIFNGNYVVLFFILLHLTINGYSYFQWSLVLHYTIFNTSRELGDIIVNKKSVLMGADNLCMENKIKLVIWDKRNINDERVTHLFKYGRYSNSKAKLIKKYKIMGKIYRLYEKNN